MLHHIPTLRKAALILMLLCSLLPSANSSKFLLPMATVEAKITLPALKALTALDRSIPEFKYQEDCTIRGFNLFLIRPKHDSWSTSNPGMAFNINTKQLIAKAIVGDRLIFDNIRLNSADGSQNIKWGSLALTIIPG